MTTTVGMLLAIVVFLVICLYFATEQMIQAKDDLKNLKEVYEEEAEKNYLRHMPAPEIGIREEVYEGKKRSYPYFVTPQKAVCHSEIEAQIAQDYKGG